MDISDHMTADIIRTATLDNEHIGMLSELVLCGWPLIKAEVWKDLQP